MKLWQVSDKSFQALAR